MEDDLDEKKLAAAAAAAADADDGDDDIQYDVVETPPEKAEKADARTKDDDEDDDDDAQSGADDGDDDERAALRERRRIEKRERRAARKAAIERDRAERRALEMKLEAAQRRLEEIEARAIQQDAREVDARMSVEQRRFAEAEAAIKDAAARGDGDLMTRAMRQRDDAVAKHRELQAVKQRITTAPPRRDETQIDPRVATYAQEFMSRHQWYDPQARDDDSAVMTALDNKIAAEGFRPETEEYWEELEKRAAKLLPHRFKTAAAEPKRRSPPTGGTREHVPQSSRKQVYVSPERKAAMMASGDWDDPVRRNRMLKYYERYDRENASR